MKPVRVGIIGDGLIGNEVVGTFGSGISLYGLKVELCAVCNVDGRTLSSHNGCMRPDEAVMSHRVFGAALRSHQTQEVKMIAH